jgi:WD40 repeat protein
VRPGKDGTGNAKLKLVAGLLGLSYDELKQRERQRKRVRRLQIAASIFVLGLLVGLWTWYLQRSYQERKHTAEVVQWIENGRKQILDGDYPGALRSLRQAADDNKPNPTLNLMEHAAAAPFAGMIAQFAGHTDQVTQVAFSPDGKFLASGSKDGTARLWSLQTGQCVLATAANQFEVNTVGFNQDGSELITLSGGRLTIYHPPNQEPVFQSEMETYYQEAKLAGTLIVAVGANNEIDLLHPGKRTSMTKLISDRRRVAGMVVSNGNRLLAVSRDDGSTQVFDLGSRNQLGDLHLGNRTITALAFSASARLLATGDMSGATAVWRTDTGERVAQLPIDNFGTAALCFSADETRLYRLNVNGDLSTSNVSDGRLASRFYLPPDGFIIQAAFDAAGKEVSMRTESGVVQIAAVDSRRVIAYLNPAPREILSAEFSPDGKFIATGGQSHLARVWDLGSTAEVLPLILYPHDAALDAAGFAGDSAAAFCANGAEVISFCSDKRAVLYSAVDGSQLVIFSGPQNFLTTVDVSKDGSRVVAGARGKAMLWDAASGKQLTVLSGTPGLFGDADLVYALFNEPGTLIATGSSSGEVNLWDAKTGAFINRLERQDPGGANFASAVQRLCFAARSSDLLVGRYGGTVDCWDCKSKECRWTTALGQQPVTIMKASADGKMLVACAGKEATLMDPATGRKLQVLVGHTAEITGADFDSASARVLTTSLDGTVRIWGTTDGKLVLTSQHEERSKQPADAILVADPRTMDLTGQGHVLGVLAGAFSPDGNFVVTGCRDRLARIWDAHDGRLLLELKGHFQPVVSVSFSPSGNHVLTVSQDNTVRIWPMNTDSLKKSYFDQLASQLASNWISEQLGLSPVAYTVRCGSVRNAVLTCPYFPPPANDPVREILIQEQLHAGATNSFRSRSAAKAKQALMSSRVSSGNSSRI